MSQEEIQKNFEKRNDKKNLGVSRITSEQWTHANTAFRGCDNGLKTGLILQGDHTAFSFVLYANIYQTET